MKYNKPKEGPSFEFLPTEVGNADAYIARIGGQRLCGTPDYTYLDNKGGSGGSKKCVMQMSGIVVEAVGPQQKAAKKAACAMMAPLLYRRF